MAAEWYYEANGNREGPVEPAVLKKLADAGKILPETRVWRQGMAQWAEARAIKGLFAAGQPSATPAPAATPSPQPDPPSSSPVGHGWHPLDLAIDIVRDACPANLAATVSRVAGQAGTYLLYVAAALVPIVGLLISTKSGKFLPFVAAIALGICLIVLQYVGARLLRACEAAIQANRSVLPSLAIPDCTFVLIVVGTVLGAITLIGFAISESMINPFFGALALLVVGGFTALVAIEPSGINVAVDPACGAGEEAVGVLTFLVKVFLRCAPIAFAAAVAYSTWGLVPFTFDILRGSAIASARTMFVAGTLFSAAAIPLYAYVLLLAYYLTLDVLSAIVSIPRKLDAIAEVARASNGNGQPES